MTAPTEVKEQVKAPEPVAQEQSQEDINWKHFREQREADRKAREEAEKKMASKEAEAAALKAAMDALLSKPVPQASQSYEDLSEDEKIEKKVDHILAQRYARDAEERKQREQQELPKKLATEYKDFNTVCSTENLDYLEYHYPEVARAFKNAPDNYDKWADVYKAVKRFVPNTDSKALERKAEKNMSKPQAMAVPGVTQVGDTAPIMLDEKRRMANWERMQKTLRGAGR